MLGYGQGVGSHRVSHGAQGACSGQCYHPRPEGIRRETSCPAIDRQDVHAVGQLPGAVTFHQDKTQLAQGSLAGREQRKHTPQAYSCFSQASWESPLLAQHKRNTEERICDTARFPGERAGGQSWRVAPRQMEGLQLTSWRENEPND